MQRGNLGLVCSSVGPVVGAVTFPSGVTAKPMASLSSALDAWRLLKGHAECAGEIPHLRELMADTKRCEKLFASHDGITLDFSRQARQLRERAPRPRPARRDSWGKGKRAAEAPLAAARPRDTRLVRGLWQQGAPRAWLRR